MKNLQGRILAARPMLNAAQPIPFTIVNFPARPGLWVSQSVQTIPGIRLQSSIRLTKAIKTRDSYLYRPSRFNSHMSKNMRSFDQPIDLEALRRTVRRQSVAVSVGVSEKPSENNLTNPVRPCKHHINLDSKALLAYMWQLGLAANKCATELNSSRRPQLAAPI